MSAFVIGALVMSELKRMQGKKVPMWIWFGTAMVGVAVQLPGLF